MAGNSGPSITTIYPQPLVDKCLRLEAPGRAFSRAMITIPASISPGIPFAATVSLLDNYAMPLISAGETLILRDGHRLQKQISFPAGRCAVCRVDGLTAQAGGFFRLSGEVAGEEFPSNPAWVSDASEGMLLWGDPHIHTTVGDCHPDRCRTRNLAYAAARHVYGLDFIAVTDHISWAPRGTPGKWYDNLAACQLYDEPGIFSTLFGYETSMKGGRGGDCNVYMRQANRTYIDPWPDDLNIAQLCERIEGEFYAVPHHTTRTGKHGEIPSEAYPGERLMPVVEIHSKWGTGEYRGNPTPLVNIHPGPSYAQDLLAQGYRFGFIGGTDSHTSLTFCRWLESEIHQAQPGLTAVMAERNHRDSIFAAIRDKHCYAACGERIVLQVDCGGLGMGQVGDLPESGQIAVAASYAAESCIQAVEIIRNGQVVHRETPGDWKGRLEWVDTSPEQAVPIQAFENAKATVYYYVRVSAQADARAWSSPCWFEK